MPPEFSSNHWRKQCPSKLVLKTDGSFVEKSLTSVHETEKSSIKIKRETVCTTSEVVSRMEAEMINTPSVAAATGLTFNIKRMIIRASTIYEETSEMNLGSTREELILPPKLLELPNGETFLLQD